MKKRGKRFCPRRTVLTRSGEMREEGDRQGISARTRPARGGEGTKGVNIGVFWLCGGKKLPRPPSERNKEGKKAKFFLHRLFHGLRSNGDGKGW